MMKILRSGLKTETPGPGIFRGGTPPYGAFTYDLLFEFLFKVYEKGIEMEFQFLQTA